MIAFLQLGIPPHRVDELTIDQFTRIRNHIDKQNAG